jgi:sigma-B regulation protein RsbU (phosphoserine phosphatase)
MPPLRRRAGQKEVEELGEQAIGLPLGVMNKPYAETVIPFLPGDCLLMYTDGVTEARNTASEFYGLDRLRAAVQNAQTGVEALGTAVVADVRAFAGERPQADDLTLVCFGRTH